MPLRVNPIVLLGLIIAFVLTVAVFASAMGGSPGDAVAIATAQVGKPYAFATDGPGTFSCAGLMRYALRNAGVDSNAPWGHEEYLSVYPNDPTPQPGDIVVYADGVAMYIGGDTVVMANAADGIVGTYPMYSIGTPLGFANPYGGAATPPATEDPAISGKIDPAVTSGPALTTDQTELDPTIPVDITVPPDPMVSDPTPAVDPTGLADTTMADPILVNDPTMQTYAPSDAPAGSLI